MRRPSCSVPGRHPVRPPAYPDARCRKGRGNGGTDAMPSSISSTVQRAGGASYEIGGRQTSGASNAESESTQSGDSVDVSQGSGGGRAGYTPRVSDRFRFDIQNGIFSSGRRYNADVHQFRRVSNATYDSRLTVSGQVSATAGDGSSASALFQLQYQDASPRSVSSSSNMAAVNEFNRQRDQSLNLLRLL